MNLKNTKILFLILSIIIIGFVSYSLVYAEESSGGNDDASDEDCSSGSSGGGNGGCGGGEPSPEEQAEKMSSTFMSDYFNENPIEKESLLETATRLTSYKTEYINAKVTDINLNKIQVGVDYTPTKGLTLSTRGSIEKDGNFGISLGFNYIH